MDPAAAFLHRREQRALMRHRGRERLRAVAPVGLGEGTGLLGVTGTRLLLARRARFGTRVSQWSRRDVAGLRVERVRHGRLVLSLRAGGRLSFDFTARGDADRFEDALLPPKRPARGPVVAFRQKRGAAPDPLAHRGTQVHEAQLRQMHARGVLTKAELEWQLAA